MPAATWLLVLVDVVVLLAAVVVVLYLLRRRGDTESMSRAEWCEGARQLAAEVRETAASIDRPVDRDEVSRRLLPLAARLGGHVRTAPRAVEPTHLQSVFELRRSCERVATEVRPGETTVDGPFLEDRLESLAGTARSVEERFGADYSKPRSNTEKAR